jgi:hypothetical protein
MQRTTLEMIVICAFAANIYNAMHPSLWHSTLPACGAFTDDGVIVQKLHRQGVPAF